HSLPGPLERPGDGDAREPEGPRPGWTHLHLRLQRDPVRHRLQLFLPGPDRRTRRRPDLLPGPCFSRHLRPRLPRRPPDRRSDAELPPGSRWPRAVELPAPAPDAELLAVPHRFHGPGP